MDLLNIMPIPPVEDQSLPPGREKELNFPFPFNLSGMDASSCSGLPTQMLPPACQEDFQLPKLTFCKCWGTVPGAERASASHAPQRRDNSDFGQ